MKKSGKMTFAAVLCIIVCIAAAVLYMFLEPAGEETSGEELSSESSSYGQILLSVDCGVLEDNPLVPEKLIGSGIIPEDYSFAEKMAVELTEGDTAFSVLERFCRSEGIALDCQYGPSGVYIRGIGGLSEFDCGALSGWMVRVNGIFPSESSGSVLLSDGDEVEFLYTCDIGADLSE